ncbi:MAG: hypothetical protein UY63_C0006G0014 [Parcubacteria group bacterium GW2011_GWA2_51_10]|nr:MAG: hypothetical protein UY63_C0006G0014 [Parcubacteria group bacterium GW2011_GWA2_51_10]
MQQQHIKRAVFFALFVIIGFIALQIPVNQLAGSKVSFTLFDAFGPTAGAFLGTLPGAAAVLLMQAGNFIFQGADWSDTGTFVRLIPMIFAAIYFSRKMPLNIIVPALAIIAFVANPVGREVWYFSLFWTIPIICYFFQERFLVARALGATFMAHSVGGALWIWLVPLPAAVWVGLIPVVIMERLIFAAGIAVSYLVLNNVFALLNKKLEFSLKLPVQQEHVLTQLREKSAL